mmetsp:Transcript_91277/g.181454  ORF Transcript_91277/g.181454 Transcript_91277/m.181454 type:complete len:94 (-) Transcript_91277:127-408(-)
MLAHNDVGPMRDQERRCALKRPSAGCPQMVNLKHKQACIQITQAPWTVVYSSADKLAANLASSHCCKARSTLPSRAMARKKKTEKNNCDISET